MKIDLKDVTFFFVVRLDSIERLENLIITTNYIIRSFNTNIIVLEAAHYRNGFLKALLNKNITYVYVEDKDPILYKTKYFNLLTKQYLNSIIAIWDADILANKDAIYDCIIKIRTGNADVALPFNGQCLDVPKAIRNVFIKKKDFRILLKSKSKMSLLYDRLLVGGGIFINREKYISSGMENENYYGWGNEDFDRFYRFQLLNYIIYRTDVHLFHLSHPRSINSKYSSSIQIKKSSGELIKLKNLSFEELLLSIKNK